MAATELAQPTTGQGGATRELAAFASSLTYESLPPAVRHQALRIVYDTLICALAADRAGSSEAFRRALDQLAPGVGQTPGANPTATIVHDGSRQLAAHAAFVNAMTANTLDLDDNLLYHSHIAATVVATCLATAEDVDATGARLLVAVAAGYEVAARVSLSMIGPTAVDESGAQPRLAFQDPYGHGFNAVGAGVGAANLRGLDAATTATALGLSAYSTPVPSMAKATGSAALHDVKVGMYGWQAWSAFAAAVFAEAGVTADQDALDGPSGFWRMCGSPVFRPEMLTDGLGDRWWLAETSFLVDPAGTWMRPAVLAVRRALVARTDAAEIDSIEVRLWRLRKDGVFVRRRAESRLDTMMSYYYLIAMAALEVPPQDWQDPGVIERPDVQRLLDRIELVDDDTAEADLVEQLTQPPYRARRVRSDVTIMAGGQRYAASAEYGEGDPFSPETTLSDADLDAKCQQFLGGRRPEIAARLAESVWKLPELGVREFVAALYA
jgi:2-methylcitrate dehydratase PrpD